MVIREESKMKKYSNGKYIEITEDEVFPTVTIAQEPTQEDRIEAQVLYTALMTDTLLEE